MLRAKPVAILLMGPSGSGKSTARAAFAQEADFVVASADDHLMARASADGITYQEAYRLHAPASEQAFQAAITDAIAGARNLIVDRTLLNADKRTPLIQRLHAAGYTVIAAPPAFDVKSPEGRDTLLARASARRDRGEPMPAHVVEAQIAAYVPPSYQEGFDDILPLTPEKAASSDRPWEVDRPGDDWF